MKQPNKRTENVALKPLERFILSNISSALSSITQDEVDWCVGHILTAKKVFLYGVGRSGLVGKAFAMRLVQMGLQAFFIGETVSPVVTKDDMAIIISNTGETISAIQTANILRRVGADVIVITGDRTSNLARAGNIVIHIEVPSSKKKSQYAPLGTLFEDSSLIFFDLLVPLLMERLNETEASLRRRHAIWV
jgi:6-phospho-3-hexuloisomerase